MSDTINNINTGGGPVIQGGTFFGATFVAKQYVNSMDNSIDNGQLTINNEELEESKQLSIVNSQLSIEKEPRIPEELTTPEAREVLSKLHKAGLLDERWQPVGLSYADMGTLAGYIADKLCIQTPWKTFGCLWQKKPDALRSGMNRGTTQNKTDLLLDRIKKALR